MGRKKTLHEVPRLRRLTWHTLRMCKVYLTVFMLVYLYGGPRKAGKGDFKEEGQDR